MPSHPKACEEGDGELEDEGCDVTREGDKAEVDHLFSENKLIENLIQHPLQGKVQSAAKAIAEQLSAHKLAEHRVK